MQQLSILINMGINHQYRKGALLFAIPQDACRATALAPAIGHGINYGHAHGHGHGPRATAKAEGVWQWRAVLRCVALCSAAVACRAVFFGFVLCFAYLRCLHHAKYERNLGKMEKQATVVAMHG